MKRAHILYTGQVQGVGFRYTAQDIAMSLSITGWVKNLKDGKVEIVAEGKEEYLNEFLDKISKGQLSRYIMDTELFWGKPTKEFDGFDIRF